MKRTVETAVFFVVMFLLEVSALKFTRLKNYLHFELDMNRLMMRSIYLMIMGFLVGFPVVSV